jgi:hypothetical protein
MYLRVSGKSDAGNFADFAEEGVDGVLVNIEGQVANKEGVALRANAVAVLLCAIGSPCLGGGVRRAGVGIVEVNSSAVELLALHRLVGLGGRLGIVEVHIAEATATARGLVVHNTSTLEATKLFEGAVEEIVVGAPAQATSK